MKPELSRPQKLIAFSSRYVIDMSETGYRFGCPTSAVAFVKRVAANGLQIQSASGGRHDELWQAVTPGKPELTIQAKGSELTF